MKNDEAKPAAQAGSTPRPWRKALIFFAIIATWYARRRTIWRTDGDD